MKILLDTHILLWWLNDDDQLSAKARQMIERPENAVYVSDMSLWEIQIKIMTGKMKANLEAIIALLPEHNLQLLPIKTSHILALSRLPPHHQDPFDRMLISQALTEPLHLITHDKKVALYSDSIIILV